MRLSLGFLSALAVAGLLAPAGASAFFRVSPTVVELERRPGRAALGTIGVELRGERNRRFRVLVQDIRHQSDGSQAYEPPSGSPFSASSWIAVVPARFAGAPNRSQPVQFRVRVPPGAEPGDHIASLTVQRLSPGEGATAAPVEAVSVRLEVRVAGRVRPGAEITDLDVPAIAGRGPVQVGATVRNTGNVTLDLDRGDPGRVAILDDGKREATLPFDGLLYPGEARRFERAWEGPPLLGGFEAVASVDAGPRPARREVGFWVIPWRELGALLLVVLAVLVTALGRRRRRWGY